MVSGKVIFLDIDRTLFDPDSFLEEFYKKFSSALGLNNNIIKLQELYSQSKSQGYFDPHIFLKKISESYNLSLETLEKIFWDQELIDGSLFHDTEFIYQLSGKVRLVIFSKGDYEFQRRKLRKFESLVNKEDIYIFPDKIEKIPEVFGKYNKFEIKIVVDDDKQVLEKVKLFDSKIKTILIDREKKTLKNDKIDALISNLGEIDHYVSS